MATNTAQDRIRVAGQGFTIFTFGGQPLTFCQQVQHTSPQPVGGAGGFSVIQPMDEPYPIAILTPIAVGPGTLVLNMFELFGSGGAASKAWDRLGAGVGSISSPFGSTDSSNESINLANLTSANNPFYGAVDLVDIFITQASLSPEKMQIVKIIRPLPLPGANNAAVYTEEYNGCVITNVQDGETIEVGTLEVLKQITITYRYVTRNGRTSQAFALRDKAL